MVFIICVADISIAVIDLLQELTDVDTLNESEEGATALIDALVNAVTVLVPVVQLFEIILQRISFRKSDWESIGIRIYPVDIVIHLLNN